MNEIVTACQFRDSVFIFCRNGHVYRMYWNEVHSMIQFQLMMEMFR